MANTTNLNLEKPLDTDQALISVINSNSDKIDAYAGSTNQALATLNSNLAKYDGSTTAYASNQNPDNYTIPGTYHIGLAAANSPTGAALYGILMVERGTGGLISQEFRTTNATYWKRIKINSSTNWYGWQEIALKSEITQKTAWTQYLSESNVAVGNSYASTGKSFTLSAPALVSVSMAYGSGRPLAIGLKGSESAGSTTLALTSVVASDITDTSGLSVTAILPAGTYYIWARTASATGSTTLTVQGMPLGA